MSHPSAFSCEMDQTLFRLALPTSSLHCPLSSHETVCPSVSGMPSCPVGEWCCLSPPGFLGPMPCRTLLLHPDVQGAAWRVLWFSSQRTAPAGPGVWPPSQSHRGPPLLPGPSPSLHQHVEGEGRAVDPWSWWAQRWEGALVAKVGGGTCALWGTEAPGLARMLVPLQGQLGPHRWPLGIVVLNFFLSQSVGNIRKNLYDVHKKQRKSKHLHPHHLP